MDVFNLLAFLLILGLCGVAPCEANLPPEWEIEVMKGNMLVMEFNSSTPNEGWDLENLPLIANGYVGTLAMSNSTFISGVYSGLKGKTPSHRARIPSQNAIIIKDSSPVVAALDLQHGEFLLRSTIQGSNCMVEQRTFAHQAYKTAMVHQISLLPGYECDGLNVYLKKNTGNDTQDIHFTRTESNLFSLMSGFIDQTETPNSLRVQVSVVSSLFDISTAYPLDYGSGLQFLSIFSTNIEAENATTAAVSLFQFYSGFSHGEFLQKHRSSWNEKWSRGGIEMEGNLELAGKVNASLYALLSNTRADWKFGLSPGGIGTNAYNGHVFWDMETWMYPSLLLLHPDLATSLLDYRIERISQAQQKAAIYNNEGTWFPWESAFTGVECCPFDGGKNTEGLLEIHINGDISFASVQYVRCSNETSAHSFLEKGGKELIIEVAHFWSSRVSWNGSQYDILQVQPPDESAGRVNNSVYTNAIASLSLKNAILLLEELNESYPLEWQRIIDHLVIPFDSERQGHPEYEGYTGQQINQADVILMQYPLGLSFGPEIDYNDLEYYQKKTRKNGYFTGDNAYSIAWLELGEYEKAVIQYERSFNHIKGPFNVWWEKVQGGHSHFITGAGGFLQNFLFGFGGIRILSTSLLLSPQNIPHTTGFTFRGVNYHDVSFDYSFHNESQVVSLFSDSSLCIKDGNNQITITKEGTTTPFSFFPLHVMPFTNCS